MTKSEAQIRNLWPAPRGTACGNDCCNSWRCSVYRVRYYGRENIPATGGVLVVSNHQSHLDPPLVGIGCPRQMNYVARETLFRFAPFGWFIHSVGAIPDRPRRDRPGRDQGIAQTAETGRNGADLSRGHAQRATARSPPFGPASPRWRSAPARRSCRWPSTGRFRPGRAGGSFPAGAESASITACPSRRPKSPAATSANCWPKSNAASASATSSYGTVALLDVVQPYR